MEEQETPLIHSVSGCGCLSFGLFMVASTITTAVLDLGMTQTMVLGQIILFTGVNGFQLGSLGRLRTEAKRDDASITA